MILADARTNPLLWRRCQHVYEIASVLPRRCLACRAVDHGMVPMPGNAPTGGMAGYRIGYTLFGISDEGGANPRSCDLGHPMKAQRIVYGGGDDRIRMFCPTCKADRALQRATTPCPEGHTGKRTFDRSSRRFRCAECEAARGRRRRSVEFTRRRAEASIHA